MSAKDIYYSNKYTDDEFEYRHVVLPKEMVKLVPKHKLMSESEWRGIGVTQSPGWIHYMTHDPEPHILLFRRQIEQDNNKNITTSTRVKVKYYEQQAAKSKAK